MSGEKKDLATLFISRKMTIVLLGYAAVSWTIFLILVSMWKPWSTEVMGYAGDPTRVFLTPILLTLETPPLFLLVIQDWMKHPEWMAPRGKYVVGKRYSLFGPYNIVGIALIAAAMTAAGFIVSPLFDLPIFFAWVASFYFNPWIAGWGCGISIFFRQIIWAGASVPFAFGLAQIDWWAYSTIGLITWHLLEPRRGKGVRLLPYYVFIVIMSNVVQRILGTWHFVMYLFPGPAYMPACWAWLVFYTLGPGLPTAAIALLVSESAVKMTYAYVKPPVKAA